MGKLNNKWYLMHFWGLLYWFTKLWPYPFGKIDFRDAAHTLCYSPLYKRTDLNEVKYFLVINGITLRYPKLKDCYTYQNRPKSEATTMTSKACSNKWREWTRWVRIGSLCMNFPIFCMHFKKYLYFCIKEMNLLRQHIKQGEVYRRSDLEY